MDELSPYEQNSRRWRRAGALYLAGWLLASISCGMFTLEFGANVDGYGHAYLLNPSIVSMILVTFWLAVVGMFSRLQYRERVGYNKGFFLGLVLWIPVYFTGALLLPLHYSALCGHVTSDHVCRAAWFATSQQVRDACLLGDSNSCNSLAQQSPEMKSEVCAELADSCRDGMRRRPDGSRPPNGFDRCHAYDMACGDVRYTGGMPELTPDP